MITFYWGSMTLPDWIAALEIEENSHPFGQSITRRIRRRFPNADVRKSGADNKDVRDYVSHRLDVLWCDVEFWRMLKEAPAATDIQSYIEKRHKLCLPPFEHAVWRAMVANRVLRRRLFQLLRARPGTFTEARLTLEAEDAIEETKSRGADRLLIHYLKRPGASRRTLLQWFCLSDSTLNEMRDAAKRLIKDIGWCLNNKTDARKEPAFYFGRGHPKSVEEVKELEDMVKFVLRSRYRFETNEQNARRYLEQVLKRDHRKATDNEIKGYAVLAAKAKRLVEFRENRSVKHHVDRENKRGLKPQRRRLRER